jgi:5-methylcytosine-specific restriction endonuclease McrA
MPSLSSKPVLVLNSAYEPVQILSVKKVVNLLIKGRAEIIDDRGSDLYPSFRVPSVVRLRTYHNIPRRVQVLTRKNIYLRDRHTCQYCGKVFHSSELTLDHIFPESRGGKSSWTNLATCCKPCNRRKANKTPEEAGMVLLQRHRPVSIHTSKHVLRAMGENDKNWRKYLYFENTTPQEN